MKWPTLKIRRQFDLVYSNGRKRISPSMVLFYLGDAPDQQVAFVASRKVGGAVQRNRAKRLMREAFRDVARRQEMPAGWFVLIARSTILEVTSDTVAQELRDLLADSASDSAALTKRQSEPES